MEKRWMALTIVLAVLLVGSILFNAYQYAYQQNLTKEVNTLKSENADLSNQIQLQNKRLEEASAKNVQLQVQVDHLKNENFILKNEVGSLKAQISNLERDKISLQKELEKKPHYIIVGETENLIIQDVRWKEEKLEEEEKTVYSLTGKITNRGSKALGKVIVVGVIHNLNGEESVKWTTIENLYTFETVGFTINFHVSAIPTYAMLKAFPIEVIPSKSKTTEIRSNLLLLRMNVEKTVFQPGEPIKITLTLQNLGETLNLTFPTSQKFDLRILHDSMEIYRWSKDQVFIQVVTSITLEPGKELTQTFIWDQKDGQGKQAPPGLYTIEGFTTKFEYDGKEASLKCPPITVKILEIKGT